jgi:hypothetical protein
MPHRYGLACHKTERNGTALPLYKTLARTGGGNRPHRNFTSPHADGVAVNAVKRSNRKYQYTNQKIIAGRLAISPLPQSV